MRYSLTGVLYPDVPVASTLTFQVVYGTLLFAFIRVTSVKSNMDFIRG